MTWQPEIDELARRHSLKEEMGGPEGVDRQHSHGKLTIRERIDLLADPGTFDEMGKLQGRTVYNDAGELESFSPVSRVRGLAKVNGRRVHVSGQDFTIRGGTARTDDGGVDIGHGHPDAHQLRLPNQLTRRSRRKCPRIRRPWSYLYPGW